MDRRLELVSEMTPAIWVHLVCVLLALILGALVLWRRKGDRRHRILGRTWVALMAVGALGSFGIDTINPGGFSPIHALSVYTLASLIVGVIAIRRGRVDAHRRTMQQLYATGLLVAGGFTLLPSRLLGRLTFGEWLPAVNYVLVAAMVLVGVWLVWVSVRGTRAARG